MAADGYLNFNTKIDTSGFNKGVKTVEASAKKAEGSFKKLAAAVAAAFSTAALIKFGKTALESAAEVNAAASQFEQTFGEFQSFATAAINRVAEASGILETRLKSTATSIYAFAKTSGMESTQALSFMEEALQVAADSAAYYDRSLEDTTATLQSFLKGNYANDAALGLSVTETTRNAKAAELYGKKFAELTEAQKQLTLLEMVKDANVLSGALGQASRESEGWENVLGNLKEAWSQLIAIIGQPILKLAVPIVQSLTAALQRMAEAAAAVWEAMQRVFGWEAQTEAINSAVDAQNELTAAVEATEEAQEGTLAGFDEIQALADSSADNAATDAAADTAAAVVTADSEAVEVPAVAADTEQLNKYTEAMNVFKSVVDSAAAALNPLMDFTGAAFSEFYQDFLLPVGTWVLGDGLSRLFEILAVGASNIDWENINSSLTRLWNALAPFAQTIGEGLLWLFENVFVPFGQWVMNDAAPVFLNLFSAAVGVITAALDKARPYFEWILNEWLHPIAEWTGGIIVSVIDGLAEAFEKLQSIINRDISITDMIKNMSGLEIVITSILAAIGLVVAAITLYNAVTAIAAAVTALVTSPVLLVVAAIAALIAIIVLCIKHWDDIKAAAANCWQAIVNAWNAAGEWFADLWAAIAAGVKSAWDSIVGVFMKVVDWLSEHVITPIGNFFSLLWSGIKTGFISMINFLIDGINTLIKGFLLPINALIVGWNSSIGKLTGEIPEISIEIPKIPLLATGAVIPPNREFLAVLGDQNQGTNIEAPLETIKQALREVEAESGAGAPRNATVILQIGRRELGRTIVELNNEEKRRIGMSVQL